MYVASCSSGGTSGTAAGADGGVDGGSSDGAVIKLNDGARVTASIGAGGGTITSSSGEKLTIAARALTGDTTITMTPFALPADAAVLGGAVFGPDDLTLAVPATFTMKLTRPQPPGTTLSVAYTLPGSSLDLYLTSEHAIVDASGTTATAQISTFSAAAVIHNCRSFVRDYVLGQWNSVPGRSATDLAPRLGLPVDALTTCPHPTGRDIMSNDLLQRMLTLGDEATPARTPFFYQCANAEPGKPWDASFTQKIKATLDAGRMVVFISGAQMTYQSGVWTGSDHALYGVVNKSGEIVMRNTFPWEPAESKDLKDLPSTNPEAGGQFAFDWRLDDIDDSPPRRNDYGLSTKYESYAGFRDTRGMAEYLTLIKSCQMKIDRVKAPPAFAHVIAFCENPRPASATDAGTPDAGIPDAGIPDAGTPDAGTPDAGTPDAGAPDGGGTASACVTGAASGTCTDVTLPMDCQGACCPGGHFYYCNGSCYVLEPEALAACNGAGKSCYACQPSRTLRPDGSYAGSMTVFCDTTDGTHSETFQLWLDVSGNKFDAYIFSDTDWWTVSGGLGAVNTITFQFTSPEPSGSIQTTHVVTGQFYSELGLGNPTPYFAGGITGQWERWDASTQKYYAVPCNGGNWRAVPE